MNAHILERFLSATPRDKVQGGASKNSQVQELLEEVRDDPVPALRNFYRTSTILEPEANAMEIMESEETMNYSPEKPPVSGATEVIYDSGSMEDEEEFFHDYDNYLYYQSNNIHEAILNDDDTLTEKIILRNPQYIEKLNKDQQTPLLLAAENLHRPKMIRKLVLLDADMNFQNQSGWTALMLAFKKNKEEIAMALLEAGAEVSARARTALHCCAG